MKWKEKLYDTLDRSVTLESRHALRLASTLCVSERDKERERVWVNECAEKREIIFNLIKDSRCARQITSTSSTDTHIVSVFCGNVNVNGCQVQVSFNKNHINALTFHTFVCLINGCSTLYRRVVGLWVQIEKDNQETEMTKHNATRRQSTVNRLSFVPFLSHGLSLHFAISYHFLPFPSITPRTPP